MLQSFFSSVIACKSKINLLQRIHPEIDGVTGCNTEMMEKLDAHDADDQEDATEDPRWEKLKGLIK